VNVDIYRPGVIFRRVGNRSAQLMRSGASHCLSRGASNDANLIR
jgi:hypothetical protein